MIKRMRLVLECATGAKSRVGWAWALRLCRNCRKAGLRWGGPIADNAGFGRQCQHNDILKYWKAYIGIMCYITLQ
jgi:hypothetical protein